MASQKVPLVIYHNGERVIIGEASATIQENEWVIVAEIDPTYAQTLYPSLADNFSIGKVEE